MNLCFMAAENVGQFQAIRDSDRPHNITVLANQCDIARYAIVWYTCNRKIYLYRTASRLYYSLEWPLNPRLRYLSGIAKQLAVVLAAQLEKTRCSNSSDSQLPGNCF